MTPGADPTRTEGRAVLIETFARGSDAAERSALGAFDSDEWMRRSARAAEAVQLGVIAGYAILRVVGRGAQGTVYEAIEPRSGRRVAVKRLPQFELDTVEAARFAREIDALASLGHPNAVALLATPEADGGRVIVMEWIDGVPLDAWADAVWTRVAAREAEGELAACLAKVASAVAAAHARGIMHRDLKPSNVFVTGAGEPKVLDFGLAKEIGSSRDATRTGGFAGTPSWAAPEQVAGRAADIDARCDVHALGLLLYRALAGRAAFDGGLAIAPLFEAIRGQTPPAPSRVRRGVATELDLITMRALEKDPARRYQTAEAFERDLRRHLAGEPIDAHPPSALYLARKFVARHRAVAAAALVATGAVIAASVATALSALDATAARNAAVARADEADRARERAERMNGFFQDLLANLRERDAAGDPTDAKEVLALAAASLERADTPREAEGDLRATLGLAFFEIGDYEKSADQYRRASDLLVAARDEAGLARALVLQARAESRAGMRQDAVASARRAVEISTRIKAGALELAEAHEILATTLNAVQATEEAMSAVESSIVYAQSAGDPRRMANALSTKALLLQSEGKLPEAAAAAVEAATIARGTGGQDASVLKIADRTRLLHNAGYLLVEAGRPLEGLPYLEESLALRSAHYGKRHPAMVVARSQLASALRALQRYDEAIALHRESLAALDGDSAAAFGQRANVLRHLGRIYQARRADGDQALAIETLHESLRQFVRGQSTDWSILLSCAKFLLREIEAARGVDGMREAMQSLSAEIEALSGKPAVAAILRTQYAEALADATRAHAIAIGPEPLRGARNDQALLESQFGRDSFESYLAEIALARLLQSTGDAADRREALQRLDSVEQRSSATLGPSSTIARTARGLAEQLAK